MTKKFLVAIALMLCSWPVFAKKVHWLGKWKIGRSIDSNIPIIGNVEETTGELTLAFTEDLGLAPEGQFVYGAATGYFDCYKNDVSGEEHYKCHFILN